MRKCAALTLSLLFCAAVAGAQSSSGTQGSIGFGPQVGIFKSRDADNARVMGGAALRLKLSQALGVEGSINYREEDYRGGAVRVKSWPVMATGLIYPLPFVYGAIGMGWYNTTVDYKNLLSETKQKFGWHFGGGAELPVGNIAKLTGDVRYVFLDYDFTQVPGAEGLNSDFYVITVGFLFGL